MATADPKFTRCPGCKTVFRVTAEQLALRGGQVRCGHCRTVFDGNAQALSLAPPARTRFDAGADDLDRGPATVTLRDSHALEAAPPPSPPPETPPARREPVFADEPAVASAMTAPADVADAADAAVEAPATAEADAADTPPDGAAANARRDRTRTLLYAGAIPLLAMLFAAQALLHFRDGIAARWPDLRPLLVRMCAPFGCTIHPLHDIAPLSIDASDLQADPAHRGLLVLTATLRNRAAVPLAFPTLELTLTDASDHVVVRRALAPADYAGGTANLDAGMPANSEVLVKMFIDASATSQAGYRLYLFYP